MKFRGILSQKIGQQIETRVLAAPIHNSGNEVDSGTSSSQNIPTKENIDKALRWLPCGDLTDKITNSPQEEGGLSILYFSSHGRVVNGASYLDPYLQYNSLQPQVGELVDNRDIFLKPLKQMDAHCPGRKYLVILDSCHSGGMLSDLPPSGICPSSGENAHLYSRLRVITSSRASQLSASGNLEESLFTKTLGKALSATANTSTISDIWLATRAILHEDPSWQKFKQEPAIFECPHARAIPFLHSVARADAPRVPPIVAAVRGWDKAQTLVLETDHCAKIGIGSRLEYKDSINRRFFNVTKMADSPLSNRCAVKVDMQIPGDPHHGVRDKTKNPNHDIRSDLQPGTLLTIEGERSLERSAILSIPPKIVDSVKHINDGAQAARELTLMTPRNHHDAQNQGYYQLQTVTDRPTGMRWLRVRPTSPAVEADLASGQCDSILPEMTPVNSTDAMGQINLLRDAVKLYQIKFWETINAPQWNSYFPAQMGLFKEGRLLNASVDGVSCVSATPGRHSVKLIGIRDAMNTRVTQNRFVYLCMLSGYNVNREPEDVFHGARMLYPNNQRQENQSTTSRSGNEEAAIADIDFEVGDSKLLVLVTSLFPRTADLCRQGPIIVKSLQSATEIDLTLSSDYKEILRTNVAGTDPIAIPFRSVNHGVINSHNPRPYHATGATTGRPDEETVQRIWVTVR